MGQMILQACATRIQRSEFPMTLFGAIEAPGSQRVGQSVGIPGLALKISDDVNSHVDGETVLIDFTQPTATLATLAVAVNRGAGMVIGTTGFSDEGKAAIEAASKTIPIVMAPNMSVGVNLLFQVTESVARALGPDYDVEIIEAHHNQKKDAPSGTALGFAEAVARGHAINLRDKAVYGREGLTGERPRGEIGIHAVRAGDIAGDHTVLFAAGGERIEIRHVAHSRQPFAEGAVKAALFLRDQSPGLYSMHDVLEL